MPQTIAFTRLVPESIAHGELTYLQRQPIDLARARRQHAHYRQVLSGLGCTVRELPVANELADSVFVEDAAIVLDELAVITRPGAESRRPETASVAAALEPLRTLHFIEPPGMLDGGDVLCIGRRIFVGKTRRSNVQAIDQLRTIVAPFGYRVEGVVLTGCLHLKSAVTALDDATVLLNPTWVDPAIFADYTCIEVDPAEPHAANVVRVGGSVLMAASAPRTRERVAQAGFDVTPVESDELAKAEGALTCCSLLVSEGN